MFMLMSAFVCTQNSAFDSASLDQYVDFFILEIFLSPKSSVNKAMHKSYTKEYRDFCVLFENRSTVGQLYLIKTLFSRYMKTKTEEALII